MCSPYKFVQQLGLGALWPRTTALDAAGALTWVSNKLPFLRVASSWSPSLFPLGDSDIGHNTFDKVSMLSVSWSKLAWLSHLFLLRLWLPELPAFLPCSLHLPVPPGRKCSSGTCNLVCVSTEKQGPKHWSEASQETVQGSWNSRPAQCSGVSLRRLPTPRSRIWGLFSETVSQGGFCWWVCSILGPPQSLWGPGVPPPLAPVSKSHLLLALCLPLIRGPWILEHPCRGTSPFSGCFPWWSQLAL